MEKTKAEETAGLVKFADKLQKEVDAFNKMFANQELSAVMKSINKEIARAKKKGEPEERQMARVMKGKKK